jgi:excisionase family DNA binding protein
MSSLLLHARSAAPAEPAVFSVSELARRWRVDRKTIYEAIARGDLPVLRLGSRVLRVTREVVLSFESQGSAAPARSKPCR